MARASSPARSHLAIVRPDVGSEVVADDPSDRRVDPRLTLSELAWLGGVRLKYGPVVSLVDLSTGGAQIETSTRLQPGAAVVLELTRPDGDVPVPSTVLRSSVCRVVPETIYRIALTFNSPFAPPERVDSGPAADAVANLVAEHSRITGALRKLSQARGDGGGSMLVGDGLLTSTLGLIQSPAGRRAEGKFRQHLTQVFRQLTAWIEAGAAAGTMLPRLTERLRRAVPARTIRVADAGAPSGPHGPDTVYFEATNEAGVSTRLIVEFPADCALEEWHFQFLRIAAQLAALVGDIERLTAPRPTSASLSPTVAAAEPASADSPVPLDPAPAPPASAASPARNPFEGADPVTMVWLPVVARYLDGRMVKGFCRGFTPSRGFVQISPLPDAPASSLMTVPMRQLKGLFFVHDLERAPQALDPTPASRGRTIEVTFTDGEVLKGTTLNYTVDGPGFFLSPHEERGNNLRVYVTTAAVHHVRFP